MLRSMNDLQDYAIQATDGTIGHVKDFYFDDDTWVIRYLVVDTGNWLLSRKVLISPLAIDHPNWPEKVLPVALTKEQVQNSPDIDTEQPVSRQHEMRYLGYYGYPYYWGGGGLWGGDYYPNMGFIASGDFLPLSHDIPSLVESPYDRTEAALHQNDDCHLRSCKAVEDYHIQATDGDIGHVSGMLVDEETWAVRYLIVNTSNWWLGHKVLVSPQRITDVSWSTATVTVNLTRQAVQDAPPYDPNIPLDGAQEVELHEYYERSGYFSSGDKRSDNHLSL